MENCKNCNEVITANFCGNCGQKKFKRIDKKYIWDEFQYSFLHTNKGFFYSIKNVIINPGKTAKEFIDGHRVNHYKPLLLIFVLSGISTFLSFKVLKTGKVLEAFFVQKNMNSKLMADMMSFMSSYNSLIMFLLVPLFAITTKIAFKKWGHNYYEHIIMNAYILSFYTIALIVLVYPLMYAFRHSPNTFYNISVSAFLLVPIMLGWFFKEFYNDKPIKSIILRVLGVLGLTILGYVTVIVLFSISLIVYIKLHGVEAYVKPQ